MKVSRGKQLSIGLIAVRKTLWSVTRSQRVCQSSKVLWWSWVYWPIFLGVAVNFSYQVHNWHKIFTTCKILMPSGFDRTCSDYLNIQISKGFIYTASWKNDSLSSNTLAKKLYSDWFSEHFRRLMNTNREHFQTSPNNNCLNPSRKITEDHPKISKDFATM